ncbi:multi-sensor signal transduction histidine kinase [Nostoc commune NIES-4072]|uniref:Multi-sensor signal transduction histidine kinase n=1 Tax=Nostoc commune NIES-4072 TaxID=2005467 RepID=A0A2R5FRS6_NOSCO|nr:histidine kinase [Nostoc commune]BBD67568.1 multi-sensor signal transduction histidine kinase [Nostoc commune HK-02]GBG21450.1 multi-sensor signal transduction histidine kinase [Nostoc commune NIES-4072]
MVVGVDKRGVGVFSHRRDVEHALHELKKVGFDMNRVSVITQDGDRDDISGAEVSDRVGDKSDDGARVGAATGGALGGLTGLLVGLGTLAIPGIGPIMLAGAAATTLATTLAGAGIGAVAGSLLGALVGLGIPEERARVYDERVRRGHYLVIIDGTDTEIARAEAILHQGGVEEFGIYDNPDGINTNAGYVAPTSNVAHSGVAKRAIGVFSHRRDAEAAITELRDAGFPLSRVSIIAKDTNGHGIGGVDVDKNVGTGNKADEGVKAGAATGGIVGGLTGLLVGLGTLAIPGIGPVIAGGAAATAIASTVAGGAIGAAAGGIVGGLVGLGIPEDRARVYSDRFQRGDYLLIIDGTEAEIREAETILRHRGIEEFAIYDGTDLGEYRPGLDRGTNYDTGVVNSDRTNYSTGLHGDEPPVIIVDRRDETL